MFKTILVAYDGSEHAENAMAMATELSKTHGAALHVVHAPQVDTPPIVIGSFVSLVDTPPTNAQIQEAGEHIATAAKSKAEENGVTLADVHIGSGPPALHILSTAESIDADLIVMGRRGLGSLRALALGSVSLAVSHGATCACLTVV